MSKATPSKTVATKKVVATTKKKTSSNEEKTPLITAKKIGANLIVDLEGQRLSRKVTKDEFDVIERKIAFYNKKPSETGKATIVKLMTPEASKKKEAVEKVAVQTKALTKQVKKAAKKTVKGNSEQKNVLEQLEDLLKSDENAVDKLQALLDKYKKAEEKAPEPVAQVTKTPSRQEVYRNGRYVTIYKDENGVEVNDDGSPLK